MNKLLFIIGMRRSGTSILRKLILKNPEVDWIDFEPQELLLATDIININRYKNNEYFNKVIQRYKQENNRYIGCKLALNPGIMAMRWKCLYREFPKAKFIFITRNWYDSYQSWLSVDMDNIRGVCNYKMYKDWAKKIKDSFRVFCNENSNSILIKYEFLLNNADNEMSKIWKLLKILKIENLQKLIKIPEYILGKKIGLR